MRAVPLRTIQELMGHASIEMTIRYAHLSPEITREAVKQLDEPAPGEAGAHAPASTRNQLKKTVQNSWGGGNRKPVWFSRQFAALGERSANTYPHNSLASALRLPRKAHRPDEALKKSVGPSDQPNELF